MVSFISVELLGKVVERSAFLGLSTDWWTTIWPTLIGIGTLCVSASILMMTFSKEKRFTRNYKIRLAWTLIELKYRLSRELEIFKEFTYFVSYSDIIENKEKILSACEKIEVYIDNILGQTKSKLVTEIEFTIDLIRKMNENFIEGENGYVKYKASYEFEVDSLRENIEDLEKCKKYLKVDKYVRDYSAVFKESS